MPHAMTPQLEAIRRQRISATMKGRMPKNVVAGWNKGKPAPWAIANLPKGCNITHGMWGTPFYWRWATMLARCTNPNDKNYARYGGRGIKVLWKSFEGFKKDMYRTYLMHRKIHGERNTTIDRIDNDKSYSKENCKWATPKEQSRNTQRNRIIEYQGKRRCVSEWVEITGLTHRMIYHRLNRGWPVDRILSTL